MRAMLLGAAFLALAGGLRAETSAPQATTATYGDWTLSCKEGACQAATRVDVKGKDGQVRPLLALVLAPEGQGRSLRLEVPPGVDLRVPPALTTSIAPGEESNPTPPPLALLQWLTCGPSACYAAAEAGDEMVAALSAAKTVDAGFTLFQGAKALRVPVSLNGFADVVKALKTPG